jgi:hypothetical protein
MELRKLITKVVAELSNQCKAGVTVLTAVQCPQSLPG